ncbi:amidohydrolase 2 [Diplocarpon rosae]|nr:amidohydrolase 2 [Diplocarpon rosae]
MDRGCVRIREIVALTLLLGDGWVTAHPLAKRTSGRIDTHIHAIPLSFSNVLTAAGLTDSPSWSLSATKEFLAAADISIGMCLWKQILLTLWKIKVVLETWTNKALAILSISTPGVSILGNGQEARDLARSVNTELGSYVTVPDLTAPISSNCSCTTTSNSTSTASLGFFGTLPDWQDVDGVLAELDFLFTEQKLYLVMTGTLSAAPDVDIILAHAGGALPYTGSRALAALIAPPIASIIPITAEEAVVQFGRFYYDLALSTSSAQLDGLLDFSDGSHVGFGSDFPYAPSEVVKLISSYLTRFQVTNARGQQVGAPVLRRNSLELLNKHAIGRVWK